MANSTKMLAVVVITIAALTGFSFRTAGENISRASENLTVVSAYEELIIQIPGINDKNQHTVSQALVANKGVVYKGYCSTYQVMMILVDRDQQPTNRFLEETMHTVALDFFIKEGTTIAQMYTDCGMDPNPNTNQE